MRGNVPAYDLVRPPDLATALAQLHAAPTEWRPFAGGTDLMVLFEAGLLQHRKFLSLWHFDELRGITVTPESVTLGALTTYSEVQAHEVLRREFPALCQAAQVTGGWAIQNRGTLGGNIANASPAADTPPALLIYDAEIELLSVRGARWRTYHGFHKGYKRMDLEPDEIISRVRLPRRTPTGQHYYRKVGTRQAQAISKVCAAGWTALDSAGRIADLRWAVASVAPTVLRCVQVENLLRGQSLTPQLIAATSHALAQEIAPIDDIRSTQEYRNRVAGNLLADFLRNCCVS